MAPAEPSQPGGTARPTAAPAGATTTPAPAGAQSSRICVLARGPGDRAGLGDSFFPMLGNGGYDSQHYTLDMNVDMERNAISSTVSLRARAVEALPQFNLDFSGFTVDDLRVDNAPAAYERNGRELVVKPAAPLQSGAVFTVSVSYHGTPVATRGPGDPIPLGWNRHENGVFVASEPSGSQSWYPVNDHPCDKATYTFHIQVPHPWVVAANGLLKSVEREDGVVRYNWEASDPMASYLATVNIGKFIVETQQGPDGLPIRNYYPESLPDAGKGIRPHGRDDLLFLDPVRTLPVRGVRGRGGRYQAGLCLGDADPVAVWAELCRVRGRRTHGGS